MAITVANSSRACRVTARSHGVSGGSRLKRTTVSAPVQRHAASAINIRSSTSSRRSTIADAVGLFYSTTTGHTEEAADTIKSKWSGDITDPTEIGEVDVSSLADYDALVVGVPTWHTGADEMRSGTAWDDVLEEITQTDLAGKKVAIFGCGDSSGYGDYFCDAMEEMQRTFKEAGATVVGAWAADGSSPNHTYDFQDSKSCVDGVFYGLPLDYDNEDDLSEPRIEEWVAQVQSEF